MLDRAQAQLAFMRAHDFSTPIVFVDSDILLNQPVAPLFQQDFDIGLTWRASASAPVNGGVLLINNRCPNKVRDFFAGYVDWFRREFGALGHWDGDQSALRDFLGITHEAMSRYKTMDINGCRVQFFPAAIYNFSPPDRTEAIAQRLENAVVVHFKGSRKRLMPLYWHTQLQQLESNSIVSRIKTWFAWHKLRRLIEHERMWQDKPERKGED